MKSKTEKSLDKITRNGEKGFFMPETIFNDNNCIIIVNSGSETRHSVQKIIKDGNNIHIYSAKAPKRTNLTNRLGKQHIILKTIRNKSSLFRSLNNSFNEIISHRTKGTRPKTFEEFLDAL